MTNEAGSEMGSDKDVVDAVCNGDRSAFSLLVQRYERPVKSLAFAIVNDTGLAQDVAQDTFLIAFDKLSSLTNRAAFGPWILTIARRSAYRAARKKSRERRLGQTRELQIETANGKLDERQHMLLRAVARLPHHERLVVMLRYFNDESVDSVARITGRSVGTVTKQLSRARERLRAWIGDQ